MFGNRGVDTKEEADLSTLMSFCHYYSIYKLGDNKDHKQEFLTCQHFFPAEQAPREELGIFCQSFGARVSWLKMWEDAYCIF